MKSVLIIILSTFLFGSVAYEGIPFLKFENEHIELGKVKKGETKTFSFFFTNENDKPITIDNMSSCDCTTLDYPRSAIEPGKKAEIKVIFDSTEKEESETVDVDLYLEETNPNTDAPYFKILTYSFELIK